METVNLILGITASVLSIVSVIWTAKTARTVKNMSRNATGGDSSVNTVGNKNRINNGR